VPSPWATLTHVTDGPELDPATQFRELYDREYSPVYRAIRAVVLDPAAAEDLTQETFVRMFKALDRYDPTRPFAAWLMTIATRLSIDHLRRRKVRPISVTQREAGSRDEEYTIEIVDSAPRPDERTAHAEDRSGRSAHGHRAASGLRERPGSAPDGASAREQADGEAGSGKSGQLLPLRGKRRIEI